MIQACSRGGEFAAECRFHCPSASARKAGPPQPGPCSLAMSMPKSMRLAHYLLIAYRARTSPDNSGLTQEREDVMFNDCRPRHEPLCLWTIHCLGATISSARLAGIGVIFSLLYCSLSFAHVARHAQSASRICQGLSWQLLHQPCVAGDVYSLSLSLTHGGHHGDLVSLGGSGGGARTWGRYSSRRRSGLH